MENESLQQETDGGENLIEKIEQHLPDYEDVRIGRRLPAWLRWVFNFFLFFLVLPFLAFQVPWVQSKAAHYLTTFLSSELKTTVSVNRVSLGIFNRIVLDDFYLEDLSGDTLIYAGHLRVNHSGLYLLLAKKLNLEALTLENASIRLKHLAGQKSNNLQFVVDYFAGNDKKDSPKKNPIRLNLRHLYFRDVEFLLQDEVKGSVYEAYIENGKAHFDKFNLIDNRLELSELSIENPRFEITVLPENPIEGTVKTGSLAAEAVQAMEEDSSLLKVSIREFDLSGAKFSLKNIKKEPMRLTSPDVINFNYLDVADIEIHINDFSFYDLNFHGEIEKMSARESSGFVLDNLSVKDAAVTCTGLEFYGLELRTPNSHIGDTLILKYNSYHAFDDFENDVRLEARFNQASVVLNDIMAFAPTLKTNTFFKENRDEVFQIDGLIKGPINRLDGRNLKINIADVAELEGDFSTRNLAVQDEQFLHLNLRKLRTNVKTLRKLIPGFKPPENFDRLGNIGFSGKFDGFFEDFVADGTLVSDLGSATMFMNLKLRDGKDKARYSGDLYLKNFDLGIWSGNKDVGKITFNSHVKEGRGLTMQTAQAKLEATVDSFFYKGYKYENVKIGGQLQKNLFDGIFVINDPNINFKFDGEIDFLDPVPSFNFNASINQLALKPLNFTKEDFQFNGKVDLNFKGTSLSDALGKAVLQNFYVIKNSRDTLLVSSAEVESTQSADGEKHFSFVSNLGKIDLKGKFDIEKVPSKFLEFIEANYPGFAKRFNIKTNGNKTEPARFEYLVEFYDLQNIFSFFEEKLEGFDKSRISGFYDGERSILTAEVEIPFWSFEDIGFKDVYFRTRLDGKEGNVQIGVLETSLSENQQLSPILMLGDIFGDTLEFVVISSNFTKILDNININGVLTLEDEDFWRVSFKQSDLVIFNEKWEVNTTNYLRIGNGSVETNNFILSSAEKRIVLKSIRNEGLEFQLKNYPLQSLEFVKSIPKHTISGSGDLFFKVKNLFRFEGLSSILRIQDLTINGDNYGSLRIDASAESVKSTVNAFVSIQSDTMVLSANGYYNPPNFEGHSMMRWVKNEPNYFDFDLAFSNYPVRILNYFVADVSDVNGIAGTSNVRLYGTPTRPEMSGDVNIQNASFVLNALKTSYFIPDATVKVGSKMFDGTGSVVYDRFKNRAFLEGGITHDHFKDFGLDVRIATEQGRGFLGFELTSKDNPVFYGTAIGSGYVRITGSFKQANLYVNARTLAGSRITIPITSSSNSRESNFITFKGLVDPNDDAIVPTPVEELRGMNMEFDLDLTQSAQMELIFDKAWGDVLKATGDGNIKMIITREGRFDMYGDYLIASGSYLFTLMNLVLNKPFDVQQGGTVSWSGDPYNAVINVGAVYKGLNTSVYNFIQEYLATASSGLQSLARTTTPVDMTMQLKGSLLRPNIDFDIDFPSLDSELRNYSENKMRVIRQDPNELNRQVFGLLVLGQFLPSGYTLQAGDVGINTLSEMLSNQLSIYLTEFVSELFTGSNLIQGIDLDISYNRYTGSTFDEPTAFSGNELQGRLKVSVSDRVSINVGGNFDIGGGSQIYTTNSTLLAGEFIIEYVLTKDRRLKIKAYNSTEPDIAGGRRNKIGAGLSFRKEFDNIADLLNIKK